MPRRKEANRKTSPVPLPIIRPKVAGIDLGSSEHWVCGPARPDGEPNVRTFRTTTPQLEELAAWLIEQGVESVAMESTHVYWIPVYELLASKGVEVVLVNARLMHHVPGRKTDMLDCQWIQTLHSCGLLRGSFRPEDAITRLRALQRHLGNLTEERTRCVQWIQMALDQMNVQVHRAVADLTGVTGMAIVRAIVAGEREPQQLATFRDKRCRKSEAEIAEYLTGNWRDEHLFNLASALRLYDAIQSEIDALDTQLIAEVEALQPPERKEQDPPRHPSPAKQKAMTARGEQGARAALWRFAGADLTRIDGISTGAAQIILTEVGLDLTAFPSEKHFVSWLRLSPRVAFSAGKVLKKKSKGTGATRVAGVLRMAALTLARSKTALGAAFRRISRHKGGAVAVFAIARKLAQLVFRMLRYGQDYVDVGEEAYEARYLGRRLQALKATATEFGYDLVPAVANG